MDIPLAAWHAILQRQDQAFDTGKVYEAVRASMSIPGVFEPKWIDGVMYVDGGVLDAVPADFAAPDGGRMWSLPAVDVRHS